MYEARWKYHSFLQEDLYRTLLGMTWSTVALMFTQRIWQLFFANLRIKLQPKPARGHAQRARQSVKQSTSLNYLKPAVRHFGYE
jgi:hypothetical protein